MQKHTHDLPLGGFYFFRYNNLKRGYFFKLQSPFDGIMVTDVKAVQAGCKGMFNDPGRGLDESGEKQV
jgi:hypothetical protein